MKPFFKKFVFSTLCLLFASAGLIAQTNPIIDLVNTPGNDVDGDVATCANDGNDIPKIFLCGENDVANLTISAVGSTIEWQILNEGSCTDFGDDCTNRSPSCVYTTVASGANFPANVAGKYRLRILASNGVVENHYFHVYKSNVELQYQTASIGCEPTGNITITNLGTNYGFQLTNSDTGQIVIPFSANNGPMFQITANGNYSVEATLLNPSTGEPFSSGCIYTTPSIPIATSSFSVSATSSEADCSGVATITGTVSNGSPNYTYELRIDDGLDGGRGTLVNVVTGLTDTSYTFEGIGQGDYIVVGINSDGCEQSDAVSILTSSDNTLTFEARVSQHITCKEGNILVDPDGGKPPYRYAIWQHLDPQDNVVITYDLPSDIQNSEFQTSEIFDIPTPGNYSFVVVDRFGCYTISNSVDIEFIPPATFDLATVANVACFGDASGEIQMNLIDSNGYQIIYYLFAGTITVDEANTPGFSFAGAIASNSSGYFPGLTAGDYTVVPNMRKGSAECNFAENITIESPAAELAGEAILIQPYTCLVSGTIRATNVGGGTPFDYGIGVPGYDFSLNGSQWQSGNDTFIGLSPGVYTIFIRDDGGCVIETNEVEILPVDEPDDLVFAPSQITCDNPTSDLTVTIVGGTAPFNIQMTAPSIQGPTSITGDVAIFENLAPGTYSFSVTDENGCDYEESYTILPITEIGVVGELLENVSCEGFTDGALRYTVNGYETTYSYTVLNSLGATIDTGSAIATNVIALSNQPGETYTINVTDDVTTCTATTQITIASPDTPISATLAVTDLNCTATGTNPGMVVITATGGWGSFEYELTEPSGTTLGPQSSNVFNNLTDTSGTYTVLVRDAGNCEYTETFSLSPIDPPVLEITANSLCYDAINGLTLTATVTSGGDGDFRYRLNNGGYTTNNIFSNLSPGTYTIDVIDGRNCTASDQIAVSPQMSVSATALPIASCETTTDVLVTANGGDGNFVYSVVPAGNAPSFGTSNTISVSTSGAYDVWVRDNNGAVEYCEATTTITITQDPALEMTVTVDPQVIPCSGENNGSIAIAATGGAAPYLFSIDGGLTFQTSNTFVNLASGDYTVLVRDTNDCDVSEVHNIPETFTLTASAAVTQSPTCNPILGTEVRILNAQGGTQPYAYSFDGGNTFSATNSAFLQPGTHLLLLQDANACSFEMLVDIAAAPENPTFTHDTTYDCTGEGTVTVNPSSSEFNYAYTIDGTANTPADSNVFTNVAPGFHTVTVDYLPTTPLAPSVLLSESFGVGTNTAISEVDPVYCYEPQNGTDNGCPHPNTNPNRINDGEYSVTQSIDFPFGSWINPNDHTGDTNGRYLAINIGDVAGSLGIIYAKRNITVVANRDIEISLWAMNILRQGTNGADPNILIELVDSSGNVIESTTTGNIPKNTSADNWIPYNVTLNPGANTTLDIVIRTFSLVIGGNDLAVDDIQATQAAEDCPQQEIFQVYVEEGQALAAVITAQSNPLCPAENNGTITFDVENFDATAGYIYSTDGGVSFSAPQTLSPVTLNNLVAGTYNIIIQDATNAACTTSISATLTDPTPVEAVASLDQEMTCTNMTAIITADATGGTPGYEYQLENAAGTIITAFQTSTTFSVTTAGDYNVRVRDSNNCEDLSDTPITISEPDTVVFDAIIVDGCYSGNNDGEIQIDVTSGNGNYQFQINNGPWLTPDPSTATTYSFDSLSAGTYTINVKDGFGCAGTAIPLIINPLLTANAQLNTNLTCLVDASITVTANGGSGTYVYEWSNTNTGPWSSTGFVGNVFTTASDGDYYFRVTDTTLPNSCIYIDGPIVIPPAENPVIASVTPTHVLCFDDSNGSLAVVIDTSVGVPPYTINVRETGTNTNYGTQTAGLPAGTYEIIVTDGKGCESAPVIANINQPDEITYSPFLTPITCGGTGTIAGSISISNIIGGTASYSVFVNGNNGYSSTQIVPVEGGGVNFTILDFGIYQVDIIDSNGCLAKTTEIIASPPDDLDIDVSLATADCTDGGTAVVTVSTIVGSGQYDFAILETFTAPYVDDPINDYQPADDVILDPNTSTFDNLTPGVIYTFVVYDRVTMCYYFEQAENPIDTPSNLTALLEVNNVSCTGSDDGNVSFALNGFDATTDQVGYEVFNFQSNLTTGQTGSVEVNPPGAPVNVQNFATLPQGEYYVLFTEIGGTLDQCTTASEPFSINEAPIILEINATSTNDSACNDTGTITAIAQFGAGNYTYQLETLPVAIAPTLATWSGTNTTGYFADLANGDYRVFVKDDYDCIQFTDITVGLDEAPLILLDTVDDCVGEGNFEVVVSLQNPTTSVGPFQLSVNGSAYQSIIFDGSNQYTVTGLFSDANPQTISVQDLNGCSASENFTIYAPLQADVFLSTLIDCEVAPNNNGEITISVSEGSGSYEYEISGPVNQPRVALPTIPFIWDLASTAGDYTVTIYDVATADALGNPCSFTKTITFAAPLEPAFNPVPVDVTCFGGSDGAIIVNELDLGIGPVTYTLSPAVDPYNTATGRFENLPAGTYSITATAANSCLTTLNGIVVDEPDAIVVEDIDLAVVQFACTSGNNANFATITVDPTQIVGGSGNYVVFEFVNPSGVIVQRGSQTSYTVTDFAGGTYTVNVYDENNCPGTLPVIIAPYYELEDATVSVTPVSCVPGADGALTVSVTSTEPDTTQFEYSLDNGATYQDSNVFGGLTADNYLVTVRHKETQCVITANTAIEEPNTFEIEVDVVSNVVCYNTQTGEVTFQFTDLTYTGDFSYSVYNTNGTPGDTLDDTLADTNTIAVNTITPILQLGGGSYRVVATQLTAPQCSQETIFSIGAPQEGISAEMQKTDITCVPGNDGIIEIFNATGGWGDYSYYVGTTPPSGPTSYVPNPRFENLVAGTYQGWVIDREGCEFEIPGTLELTNPEAIVAHLQVNSENCEGANGELEVIIDVAGGQGENYVFQLIKDAVDFGPPQTNPIFSGLSAGSYEVRIYDQWGCEVVTAPELLYEPMLPSYEIVQTIDCDSDGAVTLTVLGGSGNFEYQVALPDGGNITNTTGVFTGLSHTADAPADYVFTVTDLDTNPQCIAPVRVSLDKPTLVTIEDVVPENISCIGEDDGTITIILEPTTVGVNDNPIYTYSIQNTTTGAAAVTQDSAVFTNLDVGLYNVIVTSGRGCIATDQVEIEEPTQLIADTPVVNPFTCDVNNAVNVATINVSNISGGTPGYYYTIDGANYFPITGTSFSHSVTEANDYTIIIRDENGCELPLPTVTVEPLPIIVLDITEGAADCPTGQEITVTSTGHSTPTDLTFELLETGEIQSNLTTNTASFNLTAPGSYNIKVTDNVTGCYEYIGHVIDQRPQWDVNITETNRIDCFNTATGSLVVTFTGYSGFYNYELFDENGTTTGITDANINTHPLTIDNLSAGNYFVRVWPTEYPYCLEEDTGVATIGSPSVELDVDTQALQAAGCQNNLGEISVVPVGGYAPYTLELTHSTGLPTLTQVDTFGHVFANLPAGSYTVTVTDAEGCEIIAAETVVTTPPLTATATGTNLVCYGDSDGTIIVNAAGGAGPGTYGYFLNYYDETGSNIEFSTTVPQNSSEFNNLPVGYYSVTVTDNLGCSDTTEIIQLEGPAEFLAELVLTTAMTCVDDAIITVTASGGTAPYEFLDETTNNWVPFNETNGIGSHSYSVGAGTHHAQIRDVNGCSVITQVPVVVFEIPAVQLTIDFATPSVTCADDAEGVIYASAVGGIGQYTFDLILGGNVIASQVDFREAVFEDLAPENYILRVTSEGGCNPDEQPVNIINPPVLAYSSDHTAETCVDEMDGTITLSLSGGGGGYEFAISPNLDQFFNEDPDQGLNPGQYRFENLEPGTYTVIAQDVLGCPYVEEIVIEPATQVEITTDASNETCLNYGDGVITLSIRFGTPPYRASLNSTDDADYIPVVDGHTFTNLSPGFYDIRVIDSNGCGPAVAIEEIIAGPNLEATVYPVYECDSNRVMNNLVVEFEDETVREDALYAMDSDDITDARLFESANLTNLGPGDHVLTIFHGGCSRSYPFTIESYNPVSLALENNNLNEITAIATEGLAPYTFYFNDVDNGEDNTYQINQSGTYIVRVVDQNGCEDIQSIEMEFIDLEIPNFFTPDGDGLNDLWLPENIEGWPEIIIKIYDRYGRVVSEQAVNTSGWDGLYNGKELPTGDYWYVIRLNGENDEREFVGHFTLYR